MPISDFAKQAIGGAASQAGQGILGGLFSIFGAKKQRKHEREMYERQLADSRQNWSMENQYNSPEAQMQRLKEAGLNPNLVYGNGANAMGGSINGTQATITDQSGKFDKFADLTQSPLVGLNMLYDLRLKDAQANLITQKESTEQTVQELNATRAGLTDLLQASEQLKLTLGNRTFNELVRQSVLTTQKLQADLVNKDTDTRLKGSNIDFIGQKTKETEMSNELLELEKDLYKGINLPKSLGQPILDLIKLIFINSRKK